MQQALRPYATAGVAILAASLIAATPLAPRLPDLQIREVALTSGDADLTPWVDVFNTASENLTTLINNEALAPAVGLQQLIVNQSDYLQDFFNAPTSSTVTSISSEMQQNLANVLNGFTLQGVTDNVLGLVTPHTLGAGPTFTSDPLTVWENIANFLPSSINPAEVTPILNFLASPLSGIIMGDLGPFIAPWVALDNSISAGDDLNETLANMVGGFLNGADLNLDSLIPLIDQTHELPYNLENLDIAFGGLLTPGSVSTGPYNDSIPAVGGSIFNSIGILGINGPQSEIDLPGYAIGPLGAWEGWDQIVAGLTGADGWLNMGGPADVTAPLTGVTLPIIPTDFLDGSTIPASAAADLSSLVQDVVSALGL